jgi:predicted enzyme related to lactoylglutathione lyase
MPAVVRQLWPLLLVQDLERSVSFYRDRLGFALVDQAFARGKLFWCRLEREGAALMLQQAEEEDGPAGERGRGVAFYFVCDDAQAMHAELTSRGWQLAAPTTACYGMVQLFVPEPDGYVLCFESELALA